jgi:hypothetical protein
VALFASPDWGGDAVSLVGYSLIVFLLLTLTVIVNMAYRIRDLKKEVRELKLKLESEGN